MTAGDFYQYFRFCPLCYDEDSIEAQIGEANETCDFQEVHAHILRLFWKHQMRTGGVTDPDLLNFMMGHTPRYGGAYDVFDEEYVRNEYAKAEPYLTVMSPYHRLAGRVLRRKATPQNLTLKKLGPQRVVKEPQLRAYLRSGWRYVTILPSQRIVIEKALRTQS